ETHAVDPQRHSGEHQPADEHLRSEGRHGAARGHIDQASRMLFLPNRPRARNVTTAINNRYIDSIDHSDAYAPDSPTAMPTSSPPMQAPQKLPTPPSTMIRNAGTTASTPMCGRMPHNGARITPANAASMVPSTNTHTLSLVRSMPSACTISLSCAP